MNIQHIFVLLWAIAMPVAALAQRTDSVRWEHEVKLREVVVTGLAGTSTLKNSPAPMAVITRRELAQTPATNIIDAIAHLPGVAQITTGGGISKPVIRGLGYNRVVVALDGVRQEGQQWGDEHGIEIDAQSVGSVEVLKGPASLMYGSDALAGVIVMHSHPTAAAGTVEGAATAEYQSNNGLAAYSAYAAGNHDGLLWSARWSQKWAHSYKDGDGNYVPGTQLREKAFTGRLGLNKQWGHSHLTFSYYNITPSLTEGDDEGEGGESGSSYTIAAPFQRIGHYKVVSDNLVRLGAGYLKAIVAYQQNRRREFEEPDECGLSLRLHTVNYDVRYTTPLGQSGWRMAAGWGGMWQRSANRGTEFLIPDYRLFDGGLYATTTLDRGVWHLSGGLRADHRWLTSFALQDDGAERFSRFSRGFGGVTGSVGVVLNATRNLNLRLNVARGFRAPNISELASNGEHEGTGRYEVGNHDLRAETSWQADLGIDFSLPWLYAQASLFANRIAHYIFLERADAQTSVYRFVAGNARLLGGELLLDVHPVERLHIESTLSWVDAAQLGKHGGERYLPFTPAPRVTSCVRLDVGWGTTLSVGLDHYLRQDHAHTANGTETPTPAYTLFSASASTDIKVRGRVVASLSLSAENLADRAYTSHLSRLKYIGPEGYRNPGRNIVAKVTIPLSLAL